MRTHFRLYTINDIGLAFASSEETEAVCLLIEHGVYTEPDMHDDGAVCATRAAHMDLTITPNQARNAYDYDAPALMAA